MNVVHMNVPISSSNSAESHDVNGRVHWEKPRRQVLFEFCELDRFCSYRDMDFSVFSLGFF